MGTKQFLLTLLMLLMLFPAIFSISCSIQQDNYTYINTKNPLIAGWVNIDYENCNPSGPIKIQTRISNCSPDIDTDYQGCNSPYHPVLRCAYQQIGYNQKKQIEVTAYMTWGSEIANCSGYITLQMYEPYSSFFTPIVIILISVGVICILMTIFCLIKQYQKIKQKKLLTKKLKLSQTDSICEQKGLDGAINSSLLSN